MNEKQNNPDDQPNITNYDYVWGGDQDEYVKENAETDHNKEEVQG